MTARDMISSRYDVSSMPDLPGISGEASVFDVIARLSASPSRRLAVLRGDVVEGIIDSDSLAEALGCLTEGRDDCSVIVVECAPEDYSASLLAHAVEDADAHLVDMLTTRDTEGPFMRVMLRVCLRDPETAVRSLERYGLRVVEARGIADDSPSVLEERLAALQLFLNV